MTASDDRPDTAAPPAAVPDPGTADTLRLIMLVVAAVLISAGFVLMVRPFLIALLLAAIAASLARPLFVSLRGWSGGGSHLAAAITLVAVTALVVIPVTWLAYLVTVQAIGVADNVGAVFSRLRAEPELLSLPDWVPYSEELEARRGDILASLNTAAGQAARLLVASVSAASRGTALFLMDLFIFLYAFFFFVQMDDPILVRLLRFTGLAPATQALLHERVASISRATIKGTLLIGVAQGTLGGIGFWVAGLQGATFWGVVMAVLSVVPGLGPTLVVFGGVVFLLTQSAFASAAGLAVWGFLAVGTVDNVLRPMLVGRDARLHDVMILISTLGGLAMLGAAGLVLGPVLAGLFVAIWRTLADTMESGRRVG